MGFIVTRNYHDCYKSDNNIYTFTIFHYEEKWIIVLQDR